MIELTSSESGEHARKAGSDRKDSKKAEQEGPVKLTPRTALLVQFSADEEAKNCATLDPLERLWEGIARWE